jgi:hypothetical protein
VFRDNTITAFAGSGGVPAVYAKNAEIVSNSINLGSQPGIELLGGGPGWPSKNRNTVSGNTITTTGNAILTSGSLGYDVIGNTIVGGHVAFDGNGNRFAYNNVSGTDERVTKGHIVWTSPNSSFDHNTLWDAGLTTDSGFLVMNYGNVKVTDNRLYVGCYGNNCMATEVINVQAEQRPIYPGFPTVEIARNHITWTAVAPGGIPIMLDNEFSDRLYLHNNTEDITASSGTAGALQGGGVLHSVYENNTILGPATDCIYQYIYSNAGNLFQYNRCDKAAFAGIFQTGGNIYRSNTFTNLTQAGIWICPNAPCAGATDKTVNNAWYNNTFTFTSSGYLTRMDLSNAFDNTFLGHGASQWTDGTNSHPVYGDWLFFANGPIQQVAFADAPDGHRTFTLSTGGRSYWDRESLVGLADNASVTINGAIDPLGSVNGGTVLSSLNPRGATGLYVAGRDLLTFTFRNFVPNHVYNVTLQNLGTGSSSRQTLAMDGLGSGQFGVDFGTGGSRYSVAIESGFSPPIGDTTPPARVTDLRTLGIGSTFIVLRWTAPGDNGMSGVASEYDLRYSISGPIDNGSFGSALRVHPLPPGWPGSTETFNVTGLTPGTRYWFALRTADAVPNWSPISNTIDGVTSSGGPPPPKVLTATLDTTTYAVDVVFSQPMDRSSASASIQVAPAVAYHVVWVDDLHLRVVFYGSLWPGTEYAVTISTLAKNQAGIPMAAPFTYQFTLPPGTWPPTGPSPTLVNIWLEDWPVLVLAVALSSTYLVLYVFRESVFELSQRTGHLLGHRKAPRNSRIQSKRRVRGTEGSAGAKAPSRRP